MWTSFRWGSVSTNHFGRSSLPKTHGRVGNSATSLAHGAGLVRRQELVPPEVDAQVGQTAQVMQATRQYLTAISGYASKAMLKNCLMKTEREKTDCMFIEVCPDMYIYEYIDTCESVTTKFVGCILLFRCLAKKPRKPRKPNRMRENNNKNKRRKSRPPPPEDRQFTVVWQQRIIPTHFEGDFSTKNKRPL